MTAERADRISEVVLRERGRLRNFIRSRVPDPRDVEDILQDVFYELVEANGRIMPVGHITGWLFQVARNRLTDLLRKKQPESLGNAVFDDGPAIEDLLPSPEAGPEAMHARAVSLGALRSAVAE